MAKPPATKDSDHNQPTAAAINQQLRTAAKPKTGPERVAAQLNQQLGQLKQLEKLKSLPDSDGGLSAGMKDLCSWLVKMKLPLLLREMTH